MRANDHLTIATPTTNNAYDTMHVASLRGNRVVTHFILAKRGLVRTKGYYTCRRKAL